MSSEDFLSMNDQYLFNTYGRTPIMLVRGKGARVWDSNGREYLDFIGGLAACPLGHGHQGLADALGKQASNLIHVSNLFHIEPQIEMARLLVENSFANKAFFCNSGAEANEGAIKLARKYFHDKGEHDRYHIVTMDGSFHGRTLATLAATGQSKYRKGFEPPMPGFAHVPFGDIGALERSISLETAAVMVEPIQGEGGVNVPPDDFLGNLRSLCDKIGCLLIFDEVQTGMGRTGKLFAYEHWGVEPDIMTLAKGIAGGVPMGSLLATDRVAGAFQPGSHAATFGGNPLASCAGLFVLSEILSEGFLKSVVEKGQRLRSRLQELAERHDVIREIRGKGLMQAIDLKTPCGDLSTAMREAGALVNCTADTVLRFLPPLVVTEQEIDEMTSMLDSVLKKAGGN